MFDTNFLGHQPSGPTAFIFMLISQILSVIRADFNVIFSKFVASVKLKVLLVPCAHISTYGHTFFGRSFFYMVIIAI